MGHGDEGDGFAGLRITDAHVHLWDPRTPRRPGRLTKLVRRLPGSGPAAAVVRPAAAVAADLFPASWQTTGPAYVPADYAADAAGLPIREIVAVGSSWHDALPGLPGAAHAMLRGLSGVTTLTPLAETRWVDALARRSPVPVLGMLVRASVTSPGLAADLDAQLKASDLVRGIAVAAARHPDPGVPSVTHTYRLLAQPAFLDGFGHVAARGLSCDVWVYSHDLPDVAELARRYPGVTIVVDHMGTPAGVLGPAGQGTGLSEAERRGLLRSWSDDLEAVAQLPNTVAKISGLALPMLGHEVPLPGHSVPAAELAARAGQLVTRVLDVFGPDRTMWGSHMPVEHSVAGLAEIVAAVTSVLQDRGERVMRAVFGGTARRVYGPAAGTLGGRTSAK